jgi:hypothetical protein
MPTKVVRSDREEARIQLALSRAARASRLASQAPFYVFTLAPHATQELNTFTTSTALYNALEAQRAAGAGGAVMIYINGGTGPTPATHWTADGVQDLTGAFIVSQTTIICEATATPVITVTDLRFVYVSDEGEISAKNAGGPMFHCTGASAFLSMLIDNESALGGSGFGGSGTEPVVLCDGGGTTTIIVIGGSELFANSLTGSGTFEIFYDASSTVSQTQPGVTGSITFTMLEQATQVAFLRAISAGGFWPTDTASVDDGLETLQDGDQVMAASLSSAVAQSIPMGAATPLTLAGVDYDTSPTASWSTTNPNVLTVHNAGYYDLQAIAGFAAGALPAGATSVGVTLTVNGGAVRNVVGQVADVGVDIAVTARTRMHLAAGSRVGASILFTGGAGNANTDVSPGNGPQLQVALVK